MLEKAIATTRYGKYTAVQYARFADDVVILVDYHPRHDWLLKAVERRLREELAKLQVEINEEKSRIVDLAQGESFGFLGFEFRRVRSLRGAWQALYVPKQKKRREVMRKLKEVFPIPTIRARKTGDRGDQSDFKGLGEVLCVWTLDSVLHLY